MKMIFACHKFYNTCRALLDNFVIRTGTLQQGHVFNAPLRPGSMRFTYHNRMFCSICDIEKIRKFVLVQFDKVIDTNSLATDNVDDTM